MPYGMSKNADGSYKVVNKDTGKVHAAHTSKANAESQMRLLRGVEHGMVPRTTSQAAGGGKAHAKQHKAMHPNDKDGMPMTTTQAMMGGKGKGSKGGKAAKGSKK